MNAQAGWYRDPSVTGQLRYFDGSAWTEHVQADPQSVVIQQVAPQQHYGAPAPAQAYQPVQQVQINQISVAPQQQKSVGIALLLTFFFGPLGMLYSTVAGGLIMLGITVLLAVATLGLSLLLWPVFLIVEMVWAAVAASNANKAIMPTVAVVGAAHSPQLHPPQQHPPQQHAPHAPQAALPQHTGPDIGPLTAQSPDTTQIPETHGRANWYS